MSENMSMGLNPPFRYFNITNNKILRVRFFLQ